MHRHRHTRASSFLVTSLFVGGAMAVHDVLVARQGTPSSSSSAASTSASTITLPPYLYFQSIPQTVTCKPLTFSWFYNGLDGLFTFYATNAGVSQAGTPPSLTTTTSLTSSSSLPSSLLLPSSSSSSSSLPSSTSIIDRRDVLTNTSEPLSLTVQIATSIAGTKAGLTWPAVTVPQGWYIINATMQSHPYTVASSAFYVHTGTNTSCLVSTTSSTSSPGSTSSPSTTPIGGSSIERIKLGTVLGVSLGIVALAAAIFAAWLCLRRRSKNPPAQGGGRGGIFSKGLAHHWNGLSSNDSKGPLTGTGANKRVSQRHQVYHTDSAGTIPMTPTEEGVAAEKNSTMTKFDDDSTSNGHGIGLPYLPVLPHHGHSPRAKALGAGRTYSASSSASGNAFQPQNGLHAPAPAPVRRPSVPDSLLGGRRSLDSTTYPPISPKRNSLHAQAPSRSHSVNYSTTHPTKLNGTPSKPPAQHSSPTSPQNDNNNSNGSYATSPTTPASPINAATETKPTNRHSLGSRKRKPVPSYDPNQVPSSPASPAAASHIPPVPSSPLPLPLDSSPSPDSPVANPNPNGSAHYATRSQLEQDPTQQRILAHKSSFGPGGVEGKPLHYLIPDMPMPVRD